MYSVYKRWDISSKRPLTTYAYEKRGHDSGKSRLINDFTLALTNFCKRAYNFFRKRKTLFVFVEGGSRKTHRVFS